MHTCLRTVQWVSLATIGTLDSQRSQTIGYGVFRGILARLALQGLTQADSVFCELLRTGPIFRPGGREGSTPGDPGFCFLPCLCVCIW